MLPVESGGELSLKSGRLGLINQEERNRKSPAFGQYLPQWLLEHIHRLPVGNPVALLEDACSVLF